MRGIQIEYLSTTIGRRLASSGAHTIEDVHALLYETGDDGRSERRELRRNSRSLARKCASSPKSSTDDRYHAENQIDRLRHSVVLLLKMMAEVDDARVDFDLVYNSVNLDRLNGILAQLDARLEKVLTRFIGLAERLRFLVEEPILIEAGGTPRTVEEELAADDAPPQRR